MNGIKLTFIDLPQYIQEKHNKKKCLIIDTCPTYRSTYYTRTNEKLPFYHDIIHFYYNCININPVDFSIYQNEMKTQGYIGRLIYGTVEKTIEYTIKSREIIKNDVKYSKFVDKINYEHAIEVGNRIKKEKDNALWKQAMQDVEDVALEIELEAAAELAASLVSIEAVLIVVIVGGIAYAGYKYGVMDDIIADIGGNKGTGNGNVNGNVNGTGNGIGNANDGRNERPNNSDYKGNGNNDNNTNGRNETTCIQELDPETLEPTGPETCSTVFRPSKSNPNPEGDGRGTDAPTIWDPSRPNGGHKSGKKQFTGGNNNNGSGMGTDEYRNWLKRFMKPRFPEPDDYYRELFNTVINVSFVNMDDNIYTKEKLNINYDIISSKLSETYFQSMIQSEYLSRNMKFDNFFYKILVNNMTKVMTEYI